MASEKPFKSLEEFTEGSPGGFALIKQAKENPDVLVKEILIVADGENNRFDTFFIENYDFDAFKREVVDPIKFLQERGFKKFIPEVQPVWGKNEDGKERGFLLMKKVKGKEIEDLEEISPRIAKELDIFISEYFAIQSETIMSGGDIIVPDISRFTEKGILLVDLIVGKVTGDKEDHVYLVDLYPTKRNRSYYQRTDLDVEGHDWFTLLNNLRQKAGGKYDFLPAQAALRNYLATLERWQKRGGQKIDATPREKERPPLEFEVKIGAESSQKEIEERLSRKNPTISFLGTKDFSLYLSHLLHSDMTYKNGIDQGDIIVEGYIEMSDGDIRIDYYGQVNEEIRGGARRALAEFFQATIK